MVQLTDASGCLGAKLGLQHGDGRVDDAEADAGDDAADDELRAAVGRSLQDGANNHDPAAVGDCAATAKLLAKDGGEDGSKEAAN